MKNRIEWNWRNVELKNSSRLKILKGHDDHVVSICTCKLYMYMYFNEHCITGTVMYTYVHVHVCFVPAVIVCNI